MIFFPEYMKDLASDFTSNKIINPNSQATPENIHYLQISNSLQNNGENTSFEFGGNEKKDMFQKDESILLHNSYKSLEDMEKAINEVDSKFQKNIEGNIKKICKIIFYSLSLHR